MGEIPFIDPQVKHTGTTILRTLTTPVLRDLKTILVLQDHDDIPLAVIVPYQIYLELQQAAEVHHG